MKYPSIVIFHTTNKCNASCGYCLMYKRRNKEIYEELNIYEIEQLSRKLKNVKLMIMTGGEPFLNDNLFDSLKLFAINSRINNFVITTNGICTNKIEEFIGKLNEEPLGIKLLVSFTIDGPEERHNKEKGTPDAFKRLLASYNIIKSNQNSNLKPGVSVTYSKDNQGCIDWTLDFIQRELEPYTISITIPRGDIEDKSAANQLDMDKYLEVCARIRKYNNFNAIFSFQNINFLTGLSDIMDKAKRLAIYAIYNKIPIPKIRCYAGSLVIVILPDGRIYPCELRSEIIGDLRNVNYDYSSIIKSKESLHIRKRIYKDKCICTHECFLGPSLYFNFASVFKILSGSLLSKKRVMF